MKRRITWGIGIIFAVLLFAATVSAVNGESVSKVSIQPEFGVEGANDFWLETSGMTAEPQTHGNIASLTHLGSGLQGNLKPNKNTWIHISPPVMIGSGGGTSVEVDTIGIDFWLGNGVRITRVRVWDGPTIKHTWNTNIQGTGSYDSYYKGVTAEHYVNAMTISVLMEGGPTQAKNKFILYSASAHVQATFV